MSLIFQWQTSNTLFAFAPWPIEWKPATINLFARRREQNSVTRSSENQKISHLTGPRISSRPTDISPKHQKSEAQSKSSG
jgi:hypothetical protein